MYRSYYFFFFSEFSLSAQVFSLDSNGVTVKCTGCVAGDTGIVGGLTYRAHDNTSINAKPIGDTDWNRVVTSLVTNMSGLFLNIVPIFVTREVQRQLSSTGV